MRAITIDERYYERAKRSVDFIQRYIFPGSCIPSVHTLCQAMAKASDFSLVLHLSRTAAPTTGRPWRGWRDNIRRNLAHVRQLGIRPEFLRLWDFYLSYCEGGFFGAVDLDGPSVVRQIRMAPGCGREDEAPHHRGPAWFWLGCGAVMLPVLVSLATTIAGRR